MLKNYITIALRNLRRNKLYSLINILGLSIGLAAFIIIVLYVKYEFSFDNYHKNSEYIYRVATEMHGHDHTGLNKLAYTRCPLAPILKKDFLEVIKAGRLKRERNVKIQAGGQDFFEKEVFFADPEIFDIFTLPITMGNIQPEYFDPLTVILSEEIARKYFNEANPVGQTIQYMEEFDFKVLAIMKDIPNNSHFKTDVIFPISAYPRIKDYDLNDWRTTACYTYLTLSSGTNISEFNKKITDLFLTHQPPRKHGDHLHSSSLFLQPLTSIHLYSNTMGEITPNNDIKNIYLFLIIAFLILLIACFNYMNLTTANSLKRNREVGIRKTVGAEKRELIKQFLSESVILTSFALLCSLLIIEIILPYFNSFFERDLKIFSLNNSDFFVWIIGITAAVGFFSGSYPAFILSSFKPIRVFNINSSLKQKKFQLRSVFVVLQFAISIILIICTFIINNQLDYILSKDVGFQKDQIVTIPVRGENMSNNLETIKTELCKFAGVLNVSSSTYLPNKISDQTSFQWTGQNDESDVRCYASSVDYDYVDLYGIEIVEGRNFSRNHQSDANGAFLINETALQALGWQDPSKYELIHWTGKTGKVVGIVKDFNFHSLHRNIEPLFLFLDSKGRNYFLSVKIVAGTIKETLHNIEKTITSFTSKYPFEYNFFDQIFNQAYREEIRMEQLFKVCALITIFISCMGLLGLALYSVEKRTKEIGIRKVLGATASGITVWLSKEFAIWIVIANLIAWPTAWFFMNKWLQNFAYKSGIELWIFIFSGCIALVIALLAVSSQSIKAARANPVKALRYE
ncbi:ABC transporter permease [Calditrichota bacterium]